MKCISNGDGTYQLSWSRTQARKGQDPEVITTTIQKQAYTASMGEVRHELGVLRPVDAATQQAA